MNPNDYQKLAMRTAPEGMDKDDYILNAALGLAGESGEFADIVKKHLFQGHDSDDDHLKKELGDILWYVAMACEGLGTSIETVMEMNIDKLRARYPEGFDSDRSINKEKYNVDDAHLYLDDTEAIYLYVIDDFYRMYPNMKSKVKHIQHCGPNQIIADLNDGTRVAFNNKNNSLTVFNYTLDDNEQDA